MSWQPELDELRRRERWRARWAAPTRSSASTTAAGSPCASASTRLVDRRQLPRGRRHRRQGRVRRRRQPDDADARPTASWAAPRSTAGRWSCCGDDFTVRGGSADATIPRSRSWPSAWRNELRLPIIRIIEGSGGGGSVKTIETTGRANLPGQLGIYQFGYQYLDRQPRHRAGRRAGARLGRRARRGAAGGEPLLGHDQGDLGHVRRGPAGGRAASARSSSKQELGGWEVQMPRPAPSTMPSTPRRRRSQCARRFLSYLPSSVYSVPPRGRRPTIRRPARGEPVRRRSRATAARSTRCGRSSTRWSTRARFFEMGRMFGRSIITGLARLDGLPVAIMASDPYHYGGAWTADACAKIVRFVDLAETFHLPVVYLVRLPRLPDRAGGREDRRPSGTACAPWRPSTSRACPGAR